MGKELFSTDEKGKKIDEHLHEEGDTHKRAFAKMAIERHMRRGLSLEQAYKMYGHDSSDALNIRDLKVSKIDHNPFEQK